MDISGMERVPFKYMEETIWRVNVDDFKSIIEQRYPLLSPTEVQKAIYLAHSEFRIDNWEQQVDDFLAVYMDTHIKD